MRTIRGEGHVSRQVEPIIRPETVQPPSEVNVIVILITVVVAAVVVNVVAVLIVQIYVSFEILTEIHLAYNPLCIIQFNVLFFSFFSQFNA